MALTNLKDTVILGQMMWQVILAKIIKFPRPVTVNFQITKACNLDCPYCFADLDTLKNEKDPTLQEVFETIDELYKYGCRHIILTGGEPLSRKDIGKIIGYIKSKWMRCEIVTNGYFVKNHIEDLKLCDSVCVSLDGPSEANDKIRGKGCHDKAVEALNLLKQLKIKTRIHSILTRYNYDSGPDYIAELARKLGFPFNFSMVMLRPGKRADYINFTEEEILKFLHKYKSLRDAGYPVFTSDTCFEYMEKWPKRGAYTIYKSDNLTAEELRWVAPCNYGRYNAFVDVDGRVYKCCLTWKNGLNWRTHGMKTCLEHIGKNLIECIACRSIGDIDRALLLNFSAMDNIKMVFNYITNHVGGRND